VGHSHGLVDPSIKRSREGLVAVALSLAVLAATAGAQLAIFVLSGSVALLADLVHNFGDAATAIPLAAGAQVVDPLIGLGITAVILRITRDSWRTVRGHDHSH
jgi:divalent metal cation (Fe/Co/Zn/Cd) transporter